MTFGLTKQGFIVKRYSDILAEKEARAKELFGNDVNLSESSPLGMLIKLNAWDEAYIWQIAEQVYLSAYVHTAEGISLDRKCQDIGIMRQLATRATGEIILSGDEGTTIHAGFLVHTGTGTVFQTTETAVIEAGRAATAKIEAINPGDSGNVDAEAISAVVSPLAGLTGVTNADPTAGGRDTETDMQLRERYLDSVSKPGGSSVAAIEAALLDISGVLDANVRQNVGMETNSDGIPPKSLAPIVWGGDAQEIANSLMATKSAGIQCWGTDEIQEITDSQGQSHMIGFNRPTLTTVNVTAALTVDPLMYPLNGDDQVATAIEGYLAGLALDDDMIYTRLISVIHSVPGIVDIPTLTANGTTGNIVIAKTEVVVPGTIEVTSV